MCPRNAWLLGALALLSSACKTTPLDVVYSLDGEAMADAGPDADADATAGGGSAASGGAAGGGAAGGGAAGNGSVEAGPCAFVGVGRYALRSPATGRCLGQGAPTTVFGSPGFLLDFSTECRLLTHTWQLTAGATPNVFSILNLSSGYALDVQMAAIWDGTPVITFGDTGFDNQRFEVRARDAYASELRPQHHPQSCVSAAANSAQIKACDPTDSTQAWFLQRSDCL
ncbi:MAG TPA: RICIN domain-containing protein [Polyangiaceae bacterium]|nr:RICIN domain-containing protein [Polyangiaceae bacterium]